MLAIGFAVLAGGVSGCDAGRSDRQADANAPARATTADSAPEPRQVVKPPTGARLIAIGAAKQIGVTTRYDSSYVGLDYPMGDVPIDRGVCTDVVVRAMRHAGVDLQQLVHEDMQRQFSAYPNNWGASRPDANIDHRRVPNLMTFFQRRGKSVGVTQNAGDYQPGDIVAWRLPDDKLHIGIVADNAQIIHNIGRGAEKTDDLFSFKIIGHYRWFD